MDTQALRSRALDQRLDSICICSLLLAVLVVASAGGWLLVIGGHAVRSWMLSSALLVGSLALLWVRARALRGRGDGGTGARGSCLRSSVLGLLVAAVGVGSALGALGSAGTDYFILDPRGPDGCRAVAGESAFLFSGSGEVYAVGAGGLGRRAGGWRTDDGYRPIAAGDYTLDWGSGSGALTVHGAITPTRPAEHPIECR